MAFPVGIDLESQNEYAALYELAGGKGNVGGWHHFKSQPEVRVIRESEVSARGARRVSEGLEGLVVGSSFSLKFTKKGEKLAGVADSFGTFSAAFTPKNKAQTNAMKDMGAEVFDVPVEGGKMRRLYKKGDNFFEKVTEMADGTPLPAGMSYKMKKVDISGDMAKNMSKVFEDSGDATMGAMAGASKYSIRSIGKKVVKVVAVGGALAGAVVLLMDADAVNEHRKSCLKCCTGKETGVSRESVNACYKDEFDEELEDDSLQPYCTEEMKGKEGGCDTQCKTICDGNYKTMMQKGTETVSTAITGDKDTLGNAMKSAFCTIPTNWLNEDCWLMQNLQTILGGLLVLFVVYMVLSRKK